VNKFLSPRAPRSRPPQPVHPVKQTLKRNPRVAGLTVLGLGVVGVAGFVIPAAIGALQLPEARGTFRDTAGKSLGTVAVATSGTGVRVTVDVRGLPPGSHGMHVHSVGNCATAPDPGTGEVIPFGATAGHFDPFVTRNHGAPSDAPQKAHAGEMPNLEVAADGTGRLTWDTNRFSVAGKMDSVADRAIIIHANQDDYETDPAGNSGGRIACAELRLSGSAVTARFKLPSPDAFPEGVTVDPARGVLLTGASNGGDIWQFSLKTGKATPFALGGSPGRTVALGMHLDNRRRLFVAAGATGRVAVLNADSGAVLRVLEAPPLPKGPQPFINDLTITNGFVYVTDSFRPVLYRAPVTATSIGNLEPWLNFAGTPVRYQDGTNLNGIVASADGRYLVSVQSNTGKLYRISTATREVREINLSATRLTGGDGLVLSGSVLYVVRNAEEKIERVDMNADLASGRVTATRADPTFRFPTTAALYGGQLWIVNGQLDKQRNPPPVLPFTIVAVPALSSR
jgi:superoxide dismutase, Cu-Zn family